MPSFSSWPGKASCSLTSPAQISYLREFNEDQRKAIETAYAMVKHSPAVAKICLIHGPPGTGKSKTIVGLLYRLLTEVGSERGWLCHGALSLHWDELAQDVCVWDPVGDGIFREERVAERARTVAAVGRAEQVLR